MGDYTRAEAPDEIKCQKYMMGFGGTLCLKPALYILVIWEPSPGEDGKPVGWAAMTACEDHIGDSLKDKGYPPRLVISIEEGVVLNDARLASIKDEECSNAVGRVSEPCCDESVGLDGPVE